MYLEVPKDAGGLGLPNFLWYYWRANIVRFIHWIYTYENKKGPGRVHMELRSNLTSLLPHNCNAQSQTQLSEPELGYGHSSGETLS